MMMFNFKFAKTFLIFLLFSWLNFSTLVFTSEKIEVYESAFNIPIDIQKNPELLPFANFTITHFQVISNESQKKVVFLLPFDLTGGVPIQIEMNWVKSVITPERRVKMYLAGPLANAWCTGEWSSLTCETNIETQNLNTNNIYAYLYLKYGERAETDKRFKVSELFWQIPKAFQSTYFSNPSYLSNGVWRTKLVTQTGFEYEVEITFENKIAYFYSPYLRGKMTDIEFIDNKATGKWRGPDTSGWFEFQFRDDENFSGIWGSNLNPDVVLGQWNGVRVF